MNRGDIRWVDFDPQVGAEIKKTRPAVVVSRAPFNRYRHTIVVIPLSSAQTAEVFPLFVAMQSTGKPSVAVVDQVRAVDKSRVGDKLGAASSSELERIEKSLRSILGL